MANPEQERLVQLAGTRTDAGEDIQLEEDFTEEVLASFEASLAVRLESIRQDPELVVQRLAPIKQRQQKSRPYLSAFHANLEKEVLLTLAEDQLKAGNARGFIAYYDVAYGVYAATAGIAAVESGMTTNLEARIASASESLGSVLGRDVSEKAEAYMKGLEKLKVMTQILIEDASGFTLVDEMVKSASGESSRIPLGASSFKIDTNPLFVKVGLNYGANLYKVVYRAIAPLYFKS